MVRLFFLIFIPITSFAFECEVTHFVIPPAKRLDYSSERTLLKSFARSQISAFKISRRDVQRKTVGHVVSLIKTKDQQRWTSISINPLKSIPNLTKFGVIGIFKPQAGAIVQNKKAIKRFLRNNKKNQRKMSLTGTIAQCERLIELDDRLREKAKHNDLYFGPSIEDIEIGGTGASYAVFMNQFLNSHHSIDYWLESFTDKNNHTFFSMMHLKFGRALNHLS